MTFETTTIKVWLVGIVTAVIACSAISYGITGSLNFPHQAFIGLRKTFGGSSKAPQSAPQPAPQSAPQPAPQPSELQPNSKDSPELKEAKENLLKECNLLGQSFKRLSELDVRLQEVVKLPANEGYEERAELQRLYLEASKDYITRNAIHDRALEEYEKIHKQAMEKDRKEHKEHIDELAKIFGIHR